MKTLNVRLMTLLALAALSLAVAGCSDDSNPTALESNEKVKPSERTTIVDLALAVNADSGEFSTLIAALAAADLVDVLDGNGQFTVFAPTDEAFAALDLNPDNVGDLPVEDLTDILLFHVVKGRRMAEDVVASEKIRMLNGGFAMIEVDGGGATIDGAMIVATDYGTDNGVVHIIGDVMLP